MTARAVRHELADRPFYGTPRPLPRLLFCCVPLGERGRFCGRWWWATSGPGYEAAVKERGVHEVLCASRAGLIAR